MRSDFKPLHVNSIELLRREIARHPKLTLDIGANDGGYSRILAEGGGIVHAFEPVPDMFEKLCVVVAQECPNVVPFNMAMGEKPSYLKDLQVQHAWTLLPPDKEHLSHCAFGYEDKPRFNMHVTSVDQHSREYGCPDLIKLDVDGYEFKVLRGAVFTLLHKPCPIYFEFSGMPERFFGDSIRDMCEFIYSLGYRAWSLDGAHHCETADDMMSFYPEHTSYDIMLLHRSHQS